MLSKNNCEDGAGASYTVEVVQVVVCSLRASPPSIPGILGPDVYSASQVAHWLQVRLFLLSSTRDVCGPTPARVNVGAHCPALLSAWYGGGQWSIPPGCLASSAASSRAGGRVGVVADAMPGLACWIGRRAAVDGDLHAPTIAASVLATSNGHGGANDPLGAGEHEPQEHQERCGGGRGGPAATLIVTRSALAPGTMLVGRALLLR
ncbi:hypothetical protein B0H14DRAFT_3445000 [Mycena olivaceomarginata]|nr:hypothetical protein B0H14DRAFT_3445000 [Mycena olivaceomarginata]